MYLVVTLLPVSYNRNSRSISAAFVYFKTQMYPVLEIHELTRPVMIK